MCRLAEHRVSGGVDGPVVSRIRRASTPAFHGFTLFEAPPLIASLISVLRRAFVCVCDGQFYSDGHRPEWNDRRAIQFESFVERSALDAIRLPYEIDRRLRRSEILAIDVHDTRQQLAARPERCNIHFALRERRECDAADSRDIHRRLCAAPLVRQTGPCVKIEKLVRHRHRPH
jgi:hypothetical protein